MSPPAKPGWTRDRNGFTLVEIIVALAIVGVLLALTIPAVQRARASARRLECTNRLKQIGLTCHDYAVTHGHYPSHGSFSELYNTIRSAMSSADNGTFNCPTDPWADAGSRHSQSFVFNSGTTFRFNDDYRNGYLLQLRPRRPQEFTDGNSQTAMASERLAAILLPTSAEAASAPERYLWWTQAAADQRAGNEPVFVENCRTGRVAVTPTALFVPHWPGQGYDHFLTPNLYGCWNGPFATSQRDQVAVPASSLHSGGVNVLFMDGHVQFVSDSVDWTVWQALGTINGQETVNSNF
jgi:prepilin-type N-terminal cleavage/methylation domain-containing protein/prepilin-type processing-associated H-X9-DG protein